MCWVVDIRWAYGQLRHIRSHTPCFSLDSISESQVLGTDRQEGFCRFLLKNTEFTRENKSYFIIIHKKQKMTGDDTCISYFHGSIPTRGKEYTRFVVCNILCVSGFIIDCSMWPELRQVSILIRRSRTVPPVFLQNKKLSLSINYCFKNYLWWEWDKLCMSSAKI